MLFGTAEEGLHVVSKALETDPVIDAALYKAGQDQWQALGYGLTHGPAGYGFYGLPLPWGVTPEIDYFLRANLHGPRPTGSRDRILQRRVWITISLRATLARSPFLTLVRQSKVGSELDIRSMRIDRHNPE